MAGLPTVTLANHTSILTGRYPGHHGILHNAWCDREHRRAGDHELAGHVAVVDAASASTASSRCTTRCTARGPTRAPCRSTSRATSAPTTRRSTSSAAATFRRCPTTPDGLPHVTERFVRPSKDYSWSTRRRPHGASSRPSASGAARTATSTYPHRAFMWCNFTLTDSAFHDGGPHSEIADGVGPRHRRAHRRGPRRGRAGRRVRRHRVRARRRPRHAADRPDRHRRLGRRPARRRHPASATRATASSTSASDSTGLTRYSVVPTRCRCRR